MNGKLRFTETPMINGTRQFLSIRSNSERLPLLLYLHGGPGDAALPLVRKLNHALEDDFTVVIWEQEGTGKSYRPFNEGPVPIARFVEDIRQIAEYLFDRFNQRQLCLVGHSWGSVLGMKFLMRYPEMVRSYLGCGQVINMRKSSRIAWETVLEKARKENNVQLYNKLSAIDCTYSGPFWLDDLLTVTRQVVRYKGSLYGHSDYAPLIRPFLFASDYSLLDLIHRQKGSLQSIRHCWQELMTIDFEELTALPVPVIFAEGRHDFHVSSALVHQYYEKLTTPKHFVWFEKSCHFPQWSEPDKFAETARLLLK